MSDKLVELRNLKVIDEEQIYKWISNPYLRKKMGTRGEPNREIHHRWFEKKYNDKDNQYRIIEFNEVPVGLIGTNDLNMIDKNADVFIYIGEEKLKKQGIATTALKEFVRMLFSDYSLHKVSAWIFSMNEESIKLFEKVGFIREGIQREQRFINGKYCDVVLYGLINRI